MSGASPGANGQSAQIVGRTLVYDGWYRLHRLEVAMPDGARVERHLLDNGSAVAVLPYDPVRRTCMVITQPRAAVLEAGEAPLIEAIAGALDGIDPAARIREEAMEEAGLRLDALEPVCKMWSLPPISTERIDLFLARYAATDRVGAGGGAEGEHECITVIEMGLDALRDLVVAGRLSDAKTLILAQALMLRHPDLF
ncbi:NUDIX hydrolase [Novosphingobium pituita]|uniref:NUDIX domain-containing protein n=1 Tax=Novosphingobium pituita TaxID=3056842 RepID=A0ABQ6P9M1_9SPHN|nr:ADP-ribose pyrophosphatase [Novosphingobium sp. IK01]GMM61960.1 NUDIX domain-containing protein [Novosphingobium sp. IK01]